MRCMPRSRKQLLILIAFGIGSGEKLLADEDGIRTGQETEGGGFAGQRRFARRSV